ncbi:hypothetical protein G3I17_01930 [Streptomyces sp. SID13031]|nr:VOC family protein [Streptomyces sp. SID13031]NEA30430.1 hypothetical protein [Streptomyces sp. SID13031]
MVFWQLTIDANDPEQLARFWQQASVRRSGSSRYRRARPARTASTSTSTRRPATTPLTQERRIELVDTKAAELIALGAVIKHRTPRVLPGPPRPEGNEFCVS